MAFENEWEESTPAGTQAASLGDNRIRDLKLNLGERLDDMLYGFDPENVSAPNDTYGVKKLNFKEQASIATPAANQITLAAKESASKAELHIKDEDGDEFQITTGGSLGGCNLALTAGKDLIGSSTSDITLNTNKFTVAGATGNTSVGGTFESVGVATLADTSVLKTSGAPVADAQIANKKYVDDQIATDGVAGAAFGSGSESTTFSNGMIIKRGVTAALVNDTSNTVTFDTGDPFTAAPVVVITPRRDTDSQQTSAPHIKTIGTTNFVIRTGNLNSFSYNWIAIGY